MSYSEVDIVNIALNALGKVSIRDFSLSDTDPITGRLAQRMYTISRDLLISKHDWSFARAAATLQAKTEEHPDGVVYALPSDCFVPRRVGPRVGLPNLWHVEGRNLIIPFERVTTYGTMPVLRYTKFVTSTALFMPYFVAALASEISARLAMPLNCDKEVFSAAKKEAAFAFNDARLVDSNIGEGDDHIAQDLAYDSFISVDVPAERFNG